MIKSKQYKSSKSPTGPKVLTFTYGSAVFDCQILQSGYWKIVKNPTISWIIIYTISVELAWWRFPDTHCLRTTADLVWITSASIITLVRPGPFETFVWCMTTMTLTWPFQSRVRITVWTTNRETLLDCHIITCFEILGQDTVLLIIKRTNAIQI